MKEKSKPCGLHCIRVHQMGVVIDNQVILEDINLHIHCGKLNVIIGKNGAGKSTLIKAMLDEIPHEGRVTFQYHEGGAMQKLKIGYVPQTLNIEKNTPVSVYDFMAGYLGKSPVFFRKNKKTYQAIREYLKQFEVEECIDKQLCNLSGGQLQRVLISLALTDEPDLLLLDEPVSGIDRNGMELFYRTIDELKNNYDLAILLVSHDLDYVKKYADEVILLDSRILKQGSAQYVFDSEEFKNIFGTNI